MISFLPVPEPERLSLQLRRSFVAARAFVQGLSVGEEVVQKMSQLAPSEECRDAVIRSLVCSHCLGLPFLKPCNLLCRENVKLCLDDHVTIDHAWNKYIGNTKVATNRYITCDYLKKKIHQ